MGEVIAFRKREKPSRNASEAPPTGDAQILFFLGVRYVRMEDYQSQVPGGRPRGGGKGKRRARA
jgi:hypothetical protein